MLIGRDPRPSGPELVEGVVEGVVQAGGIAHIAGVLPTSGVAEGLVVGLGAVGVMVTASHNPAADNGFKILAGGGRKPDDALAATLEAWLAEPWTRSGGERVRLEAQAAAAYEAAVGRAVAAYAVDGAELVIDLANGAASAFAGWLQRALPGVMLIGAGDGVVNAGVGSEHPEALGAAARATGRALGFAVDGDADRCVLVGPDGERVPGDALAWLLARGLGVDALAVTVMSSTALEATLPGVRVVRTPVGDRHLGEAMAREGLRLGCEESGHVLFDDALAGGDGLVAGLRAAAMVQAAGGLAAALDGFRVFPRALTKVRVSARRPLDQVAPLAGVVSEHSGFLGESGRIFLRYSGTEPVLRILVEGPDAAVVEAASRAVTAAAAEHLR